jgi:mono/diheme cytochrome c family protein
MRTIRAFFAFVVAAAVGGAGFIYSGLYDVAASTPHWSATTWLLKTARARSIAYHAAGVMAPPGLDDTAMIEAGVAHFAAHCAICHGAPGVPRGDIAKGLYPSPPGLSRAAVEYGAGELFWILKHGIKMSGMPSWQDHSDAELWATVAFLERLPAMTEAEYARLLMASLSHGGHHLGGDRPLEADHAR